MAVLDYTCKVSEARAYHFRLVKPEHTWADITIEEWENGGSFKCISDYGNYSYAWNSIGNRNLRQFLIGLNFDYFMTKTMGSKFEIFDKDRTIANLRKEVYKARRSREISADDFRTCWEELEEGELLDVSDASDIFWERISSAAIVRVLYDDDLSAVPCFDKPDPQCQGFWDTIWPMACDYWKKEVEV